MPGPVEQTLRVPQTLPEQQTWPALPHGRHVPLEHTIVDPAQNEPPQQGWPLAPHAMQVPE
jgi:hypothetical protein